MRDNLQACGDVLNKWGVDLLGRTTTRRNALRLLPIVEGSPQLPPLRGWGPRSGLPPRKLASATRLLKEGFDQRIYPHHFKNAFESWLEST